MRQLRSRVVKTILVSLFSLFIESKMEAQFVHEEFKNEFYQVNTFKGLSSDFVHAIAQDKNNFIWIGTEYGLNRYDGNQVEIFYHQPGNEQSIIDNFVSALMVDSKNRLWIGTEKKGISILDLNTYKFKHFTARELCNTADSQFEYITCFYEDKNHDIWIGTWGAGLIHYNSKKDKFEQYSKANAFETKIDFKSKKVKSVVEDKQGNLWIGTWAEGQENIGLYYINTTKQKCTSVSDYFSLQLTDKQKSIFKFIHQLTLDKFENLWVAGFLGTGFINLNTKNIAYFTEEVNETGNSINSKSVRCLTEWNGRAMLIGTIGGGINYYDYSSSQFQYIKSTNLLGNALANNTIRYFFIDNKNTLFLSALGGGVNIKMSDRKEMNFFSASQIQLDKEYLNTGISALLKLNKSNVVLGTKYGAKKYNVSSKKYSNLIVSGENEKNLGALEFYPNPFGPEIWITTHKDLYIYDTLHQSCKRLNIPNTSLGEITDLLWWNKDTVIYVQEFAGVSYLLLKSMRIEKLALRSKQIGYYNCVAKFNQHELLIGYAGGIAKVNIRNGAAENLLYNYFPDNKNNPLKTNKILRDKNGDFWFTCFSGLGKLIINQRKYELFSKQKLGRTVEFKQLVEDSKGNIWMNSDHAIFHFDKKTKKTIEVYDRSFANHYDLNGQLLYNDEEDRLYLGSSDGMLVVNARTFYNEVGVNNITITKLLVSNQPKSHNVYHFSDTILRLKYNQNTIHISIGHFNYNQERCFQLEYKLEGMDTVFKTIPMDQQLHFANLSEGKYVLIVKYSQYAVEHPTTLRLLIVISKPYWKEWWFVALMLILLIAITVFFVRIRTRKLLADKVLLESKVQERTEDLQKEKELTESLLLNILPKNIADELKTKGKTEAKLHENVSILFTDFVNFTGIASRLSPTELVNEIDAYFQEFDSIIEKFGLEKIKTIGDAYLAVCGLPVANDLHAVRAIEAAKGILEFVRKKNSLFEVRIGIHTGAVVAGIVGYKKYAYDVWGDTVNIASRMESNSEPMKINVSKDTYNLCKDNFDFTFRGKLEVKNKGEMEMYFVN